MIDFTQAPEIITPNLIAKYACRGIQRAMQFSEAQVYASAMGGYIEGQDNQVIQVIPGGQRTDGAGNGAQDGGSALIRRMGVTLWYWLRMNIDMHSMTQEKLIEESDGVLNFMERLRMIFANTDLGGLLTESMRYEGTGEVQVYEEERGIVYCTLSLSAPFAVPLPTDLTLTADDLAGE